MCLLKEHCLNAHTPDELNGNEVEKFNWQKDLEEKAARVRADKEILAKSVKVVTTTATRESSTTAAAAVTTTAESKTEASTTTVTTTTETTTTDNNDEIQASPIAKRPRQSQTPLQSPEAPLESADPALEVPVNQFVNFQGHQLINSGENLCAFNSIGKYHSLKSYDYFILNK